MSYDIYLKNPETGDTVQLPEPHQIKGGTHCLGGTTEAWLNVTYNYSGYFRAVLGDEGIRSIYGMTAADSIPLLEEAAAKLDENEEGPDEDYWKATSGNARAALLNLIALARLAPPDAVWSGD